MENLKSRSISFSILAIGLFSSTYAHALETPVIVQEKVSATQKPQASATPEAMKSMPVAVSSQSPQGTLTKNVVGVAGVQPTAPNPSTTNQGFSIPKALEGVVTVEEFKKYLEYQTALRNQPEVKILNDKIMVHVKEMQVLQGELDVLRKKAMESNPGAKEVGDKIQNALRKAAPPQTTAPNAPRMVN